MFILPRDQFTILDDWGYGRTIGLHASSSNSMEIEDVFVPEYNTVVFNFKDIVWGDEGTTGWQLHRNPLYLGRTAAVFIAGLTQTQVGNALACMDEWLELMERGTSFAPRGPRKESQFYQHWTGEIVSAAEASQTLLLGAIREYMRLNEAWTKGGAEFTAADDVRIRGQIVRAAQLAQQAIETAFMYGGTSSVALAGKRMGKYYQDAAMYRTHIGYMPEVLLTNLGRVLSGQPLQM